VAAAQAGDWVAIAPAQLLVMDLAPTADGAARQVVIQLLPAPWSQGWVGNIRKLTEAHFWDGTAINRVQDGYVVQWGDPDAENKARARALPLPC
jgi:peptidylprolyl isomerase